MANGYSDPNFNIDTSTNVAGLTALKGGAPDADDKIYIYNGATLTVESNLACLLISLGETSAGAATDGQRVGHLTVNAGVTITFTGNATATNSGIKSNPASAPGTGGESKGSTITVNGTTASPTIFTNSAGAYNASNRYLINQVYGIYAGSTSVLQINYPSPATGGFVWLVPLNANYSTASEHNFGTISHTSGNFGSTNYYIFSSEVTASRTLDITIEDLTVSFAAQTTTARVVFVWSGQTNSAEIGAFTIKRMSVAAPGGAVDMLFSPFRPYIDGGTTWYASAQRYSQAADIRVNTTVPTGLAIADLGNGKGGLATITNAASYADTDEIIVTASDGTTVIGRGTKADYTANSGIVCGNVTLGTLRSGDKCFATSDLFVKSAFSGAAADWTPNKRTVPAVGKVMADAGDYGDGGAELTPTLPLNKVHQDQGGTLDLPALNKVAPSDTLEGSAGTMDLPALNKVAPSDTLEGSAGTLDLPALNKVAPSDTLEGSAGTLDLPALNKVAPSDTLEGSAGTLDLPALNKVAPSDTLEGEAGTMDLPALTSVIEADTLETVAGTYHEATAAEVQDGVMFGPASAYEGELAVKDLTFAEEATRNTDPGIANVAELTAYKILNVDKVGTLEAGGAPQPTAPTWGTTPLTAGSGQVTLSVVPAAGGDVVYARYKTKGATTWVAESEAFKRTGTGTITVTGLTNGQRYVFSGYTKAAGVTSNWLPALEETPKLTTVCTPENALRALLLDDTDLTALVSTRIYPQYAAQSGVLPYLVYQRVDSDVQHHMSAASGLNFVRVQVECYAASYAACHELAEVVRLACDGYQGTVTDAAGASLAVKIRRESEGDGFSEPIAGKDRGAHRVVQDYVISHTETVATFA